MSETSPFAAWFDGTYRRENESRAQALARLQTESGLGFTTLYYALRGARVQPESARKLEEFSSGAVTASSLVLAPSRREVRAREPESEPSAPPAA